MLVTAGVGVVGVELLFLLQLQIMPKNRHKSRGEGDSLGVIVWGSWSIKIQIEMGVAQKCGDFCKLTI
jgi:hypothetical protein